MHTTGTPQTPQPPITPPHCRPYVPFADMEATKSASMFRQRRWLALSASDDVAGTWKWFFVSSTSALCSYTMPLRINTSAIKPDAHEVLEHAKVQEPLLWFLPLATPHQQGVAWDEQRGYQRPLFQRGFTKKTPKPRRCRRNALRRFLATLAMIGRNYAPDLDSAHPQGVQWDTLERFMAVGVGELVDTPMLRAFFARAASAIILYVL